MKRLLYISTLLLVISCQTTDHQATKHPTTTDAQLDHKKAPQSLKNQNLAVNLAPLPTLAAEPLMINRQANSLKTSAIEKLPVPPNHNRNKVAHMVANKATSKTTKPSQKPNLAQAQKVNKHLNKQVCRDEVAVSYAVTDANGISGQYQAVIQAQALIIGFSRDNRLWKLKTTGWHSPNSNLQHWRPYLKKPPLAKDIPLQQEAEFWSEKSAWYLCQITASAN